MNEFDLWCSRLDDELRESGEERYLLAGILIVAAATMTTLGGLALLAILL